VNRRHLEFWKKNMKMKWVFALALMAGHSQAAIYKCRSAGVIVYQDAPCPGAKEIDNTNGANPSVEDQVRAHDRAARDRELVSGVKKPLQSPASKNPNASRYRIPASAPVPSIITNCDPGGCWDNLGGRYNHGAGPTYFGPSGRACNLDGGQMACP
jgi:hypothetical protein